jgi:hypothetical protein
LCTRKHLLHVFGKILCTCKHLLNVFGKIVLRKCLYIIVVLYRHVTC